LVDLHSIPHFDLKINMGENISNVDIWTAEHWFFLSSWLWRILTIGSSNKLDMDNNYGDRILIPGQAKRRAKKAMESFSYCNFDLAGPVYSV